MKDKPLSAQMDVKIQEAFENRVLHGLACEWETALWVLPYGHRTGMKNPLIAIRDMKSRWGYWSGEKREICLSRDLVYNYPWKEIRRVLHHEMAHQLADQILGESDDEPPHGPAFQKACYLLRIGPNASQDPISGENRTEKGENHKEMTMVHRVKKLMALAGSQNVCEAEAAMAKAHELIAKYSIDMLAGERSPHFTSECVGKPALRHSRDVYHLANLLQDFYFVDPIWVSAYVLERGKMGRVLEISGTRHNVEIAGYVYDYVRYYSHCQWQKYNNGKHLNNYRKTDFFVGVIEGFREKLNAQYTKWKKEKNRFALIKLKDPLLTAYTAYKYPHITRFKRRATQQDARVIHDGVGVGKKMVLHKAITKREGFKNKLLEH